MKLRQKLLASTAAVVAAGILNPTATAQTSSAAEVAYRINYPQGLGNL